MLKDISFPIKLIASFENLNSIFPFFVAGFDRGSGISVLTTWIFIPTFWVPIFSSIIAALDAMTYSLSPNINGLLQSFYVILKLSGANRLSIRLSFK